MFASPVKSSDQLAYTQHTAIGLFEIFLVPKRNSVEAACKLPNTHAQEMGARRGSITQLWGGEGGLCPGFAMLLLPLLV